MKSKRRTFQFVIFLATAVMWLSGCECPCGKDLELCPGAESVADAVYGIQKVSRETMPMKAIGKCNAKFTADGREHNENFDVKLWLEPPYKIRLQGDIFLNPKGIVLGSNDEEFWFSMKPELSSYYWGRWNEAALSKSLLINPENFIEAFGTVSIYDEQEWSLERQGPFDVLVRTGRAGKIVKKIYIYNCDYLIRKIEHFNDKEEVIVQIELDRYKEVSDNVLMPSKIILINTYGQESQDVFKFAFNSIKPYKFSQKQKEALFSRPEPKGFKSVYKIVEGKAIELQN